MPYGIDKDIGGDSDKNDAWMEECVRKVMKQGKSKESAIAICKASLKKTKGEHSKAEFIISEILFGKVGSNKNG